MTLEPLEVLLAFKTISLVAGLLESDRRVALRLQWDSAFSHLRSLVKSEPRDQSPQRIQARIHRRALRVDDGISFGVEGLARREDIP